MHLPDTSTRSWDLDRFYSLLHRLRQRTGGFRYLKDCEARTGWPRQGIYFFFEPEQFRANGSDLRVVRVGTHAVSAGSRTTLWNRLAQHRGRLGGSNSGGGNHRGSIFRLHVGTALLNSRPYPEPVQQSWGKGGSAPREIMAQEAQLERDVSEHIRSMPLLWLAVPGEAGPESHRKTIERNAIALLSNWGKAPLDPPSPGWLGQHADREAVRLSGLWNVDHVTETYDEAFLGLLEQYIFATHP